MSALERRIGEPKLSKDGTCWVRTAKIGNRVLGHIEAPKTSGRAPQPGTFWGAADVFFLSAHLGAIYVAKTAIAGLRMYGVTQIGLRLPDGSTYTAELNAVKAIKPDPAKRYLAVPMELWTVVLPPEDERVANTMSKMRIAGGRRKTPVSAGEAPK